MLLIAMFFFGGKQLPEIARGLGQGRREFKRVSEGAPTARTRLPRPNRRPATAALRVQETRARLRLSHDRRGPGPV